MYRGSKPKILPVIIVIVVVVLVIASIVAIGRMMFSGDKQPVEQPKDGDSLLSNLLDTSADRAVRWTVRGPIVANEDFRTYQITITPNSRTYDIYSDYLDTYVEHRTYDNNIPAYEQFVYALEKAEITKVRSVADADIRGVCATDGLAFQFETLADKSSDNMIWSSTCKGSPGTMSADPLKLQALFVNQIPDFHPLFDNTY